MRASRREGSHDLLRALIDSHTCRYDKKKADADKKKRLYASAFAYIRSQTGMNKKEFAEYLGIPYRTLQRQGDIYCIYILNYLMNFVEVKLYETHRKNI